LRRSRAARACRSARFWFFHKPVRRLYYNAVITFASVFVAVAIGTAEILGMLVDRLHLTGPLWNAVGSLDDHLGVVGFVVIASFVVIWAAAAIVYKLRGWDELPASSVSEAFSVRA
jgi:high-affinity nickel-transport protein